MSIKWADYANYPRSEGYMEKYEELLSHADKLIKRGLVSVLPAHEKSISDAGANFILYNSAISEYGLVSQAIPDFKNENTNIQIPNGMISGGGISQSGYKSKYELTVNSPCKLNGISDQWKALAYLRVGRTLKYMRRANAGGYVPIATDEVNHNLCEYLSTNLDYTQNINTTSVNDIINYGFSIGLVNTIELENALNEMSWDDVLKLRKEVLPSIAKLKNHIINKICSGMYYQGSKQKILNSIDALRADFEKKQDEISDEWEKLRIASIFRAGGASGAGAIGISLFPLMASTWQEILVRVIGMGLVSMATLTPEIKTLIPAQRRYRNHPLYFTTMLPKQKS